MSSIPPDILEYSLLRYVPVEDLYTNMKIDPLFSKVYRQRIRELLKNKVGLAKILSLGLKEHDYRLLDLVFDRIDANELETELRSLVADLIGDRDVDTLISLMKNSEWFDGTPYSSLPYRYSIQNIIKHKIAVIIATMDLQQDLAIKDTLLNPGLFVLFSTEMVEIFGRRDPNILLEILPTLNWSCGTWGVISAYLESFPKTKGRSENYFITSLLCDPQSREQLRNIIDSLDSVKKIES